MVYATIRNYTAHTYFSAAILQIGVLLFLFIAVVEVEHDDAYILISNLPMEDRTRKLSSSNTLHLYGNYQTYLSKSDPFCSS